jgi:FkbM family methyltransferase
MDLRGNVKQLFRMCGHAVVVTIHERLDAMFRAIDSLSRVIQEHTNAVERENQQRKAEYANLAKSQTALLQAATHQTAILHQIADRTTVKIDGPGSRSPEAGLMEFLYSYLPVRAAIDVGAHTGEISESLLATGYEVYAFEPFPPSYEKLIECLGKRRNFYPFRMAVGSRDGEMLLHLAQQIEGQDRYDPTLFNSLSAHAMEDGLRFEGTLPVAVASLASLHASKQIPEQVGLVKIDTEGCDLEVIRGMGAHRYPVVVAEFWDEAMPLAKNGLSYNLKSLVAEMRERGYPWHTVLYQIWMERERGYYSNYSRTIPNSWGNVFFFRDFNTFSQADAWCSAALPRAYFTPSDE